MGSSDEGLDDSVPRVTGWSKSDELQIGEGHRISMQADFGAGGDFTVQFDRIINADRSSAQSPIQTVAEITWSVEGNSMVRRVSVGTGVTVSGVAQAVRVVVWDETIEMSEAPPLDVGEDYQVNISVAPGTRSSLPFPPTYTPIPAEGGYYVAPTATLVVAIPQNVGINSIRVKAIAEGTSTPIVKGTCQAKLLLSGGLPAKWWYPEEDDEWITLPPGVLSLELHNAAGAGATMFFSVDFGVDG